MVFLGNPVGDDDAKKMQLHMYRIGHLYQICLFEVILTAEVRQGLSVCYFGNSS